MANATKGGERKKRAGKLVPTEVSVVAHREIEAEAEAHSRRVRAHSVQLLKEFYSDYRPIQRGRRKKINPEIPKDLYAKIEADAMLLGRSPTAQVAFILELLHNPQALARENEVVRLANEFAASRGPQPATQE